MAFCPNLVVPTIASCTFQWRDPLQSTWYAISWYFFNQWILVALHHTIIVLGSCESAVWPTHGCMWTARSNKCFSCKARKCKIWWLGWVKMFLLALWFDFSTELDCWRWSVGGCVIQMKKNNLPINRIILPGIVLSFWNGRFLLRNRLRFAIRLCQLVLWMDRLV